MRGAPLRIAAALGGLQLATMEEASIPGSHERNACTLTYTQAYMSTLNGECSQLECMPADEYRVHRYGPCQGSIDDVRDKCRGLMYNETDSITGQISERSFLQKALGALQLMGPRDCDYAAEPEPRCDSGCSMASVTDNQCLSVDPISGPSDPLAAWHSCEGVCRAQLEHLVDTCGGCADPALKKLMDSAGRRFVSCATRGGRDCGAIKDVLNTACCAAGDTCDIENGVAPLDCSQLQVCSAAVQAAGIACPESFENDFVMMGLFLDCGGDLQQLFAAAPVDSTTAAYCPEEGQGGIAQGLAEDTEGLHSTPDGGKLCDRPLPPAHAALGSCDAELQSGESCEMTCQTGWCVAGSQPKCSDGQMHSSMRCEPQPIVSCLSPPNGGCNPHTTCSDATNLFGTKLVQCSECPRGYFGSGRSGCFDINECTVMRNGGCDVHTTCHNFDGGYNCSDCPAPLVGNSFLDGGCHTPSKPPGTAASIFTLGHTAGTCTGTCPGNDCEKGLTEQQLTTRDACDAKNTMANRCDCVWTPPDTTEWNIWFVLLMCLCVAASVGAVCALCSKKQYKTEGGNMEKIDVGSIGTGPSIYDSTWAR